MNQEHHFQNNLKRIRKEAGLRQIDVAEKLGHTSADRISHWEKGLAAPGLVNLFKLSIIYKASLEELYPDLYVKIVNELKDQSNSKAVLFTETVKPALELVPKSAKT